MDKYLIEFTNELDDALNVVVQLPPKKYFLIEWLKSRFRFKKEKFDEPGEIASARAGNEPGYAL